MRTLIIILFLSSTCFGQTYNDTIKKAVAYTNTYLPFGFYGTTMVRIDLTSGKTTYKILEGTNSSSSVLWTYVFDSSGNFYLGLNSANRRIWRFNLKDSIFAKNLGNGFQDGGALAYSMSLGRDGHLYFGASSGNTYWSEYDPVADIMYQHPLIDDFQDYVLSINV